MSKELRLTKRIIINLQIDVLTGIHIGGSKESYGIGGVDLPVIKDPVSGKPIIPGSSLKGKIRSLMELAGIVTGESLVLFAGNELGPTRCLFRDCHLSNESCKLLEARLGENVYTEIKAENTIDKFTGTTKMGGLRFIERVPMGVSFEGEIVINGYNDDDINDFYNKIEAGCRLLEANYLGGSGSRGYGKVKLIFRSKQVL